MSKFKMIDPSFYDSKWEEWNDMISFSPAPRIRRSKIIDWLKNLSIHSLLDVGCGNGEFLNIVREVNPQIKLAGADISPHVIQKNRLQIPDAEFHTLNLNEGAIHSRFDAVVCMEVIEHCEDYRAAIDHLAAMTKKYLLITVPCGPIFEIDRRVGHIRHFKAEEIRNMLIRAGLNIVDLQCWGFPFFNLYKHMINLSPDKMSGTFLSSDGYGLKQKAVSLITYGFFKLCFSRKGYQLFVLASK